MVLAVAALVLATALGALVWSDRRRRRALTERIDVLAGAQAGVPRPQSRSPEAAVDLLDRALELRDVHATEELELEADRYRSALGSITLGVVLVDENGAVRFRNAFAAAFLRGRHGEAVVAQVIDELSRTALGGDAVEQEVQIYGPPRRRLFVTATPITDEGSRLGVVVLIDDITEQERLDAIRRDFVANISHELRTPIGAMSLLAETLVDETDPDVIAPLADRLSTEATRLGQTIDDLLQLSRIEHGSDEHFAPVILQRVIANAQDRVRSAAEQRGVDIGTVVPERPLVVRGDEIQLTSAVYNLLDNATKYMGADGGTVSVRARAAADNVEVVVQDSGIGIPRKDLDRIFERFYRVDQARSRQSGGTGLGLSIVRHIVANHGGAIRVESTEGEGTTFTMQIPMFSHGGDDTSAPGDDPGMPVVDHDPGTDQEVTRP